MSAATTPLMTAHQDYIEKVKAAGVTVATAVLPCCSLELEFPLPSEGETWDSFMTCPGCENILFRVSTPDGVSFRDAPSGKAEPPR